MGSHGIGYGMRDDLREYWENQEKYDFLASICGLIDKLHIFNKCGEEIELKLISSKKVSLIPQSFIAHIVEKNKDLKTTSIMHLTILHILVMKS